MDELERTIYETIRQQEGATDPVGLFHMMMLPLTRLGEFNAAIRKMLREGHIEQTKKGLLFMQERRKQSSSSVPVVSKFVVIDRKIKRAIRQVTERLSVALVDLLQEEESDLLCSGDAFEIGIALTRKPWNGPCYSNVCE